LNRSEEVKVWLRALSVIGNIASILALPSLVLIYLELYKARKAAGIPRGVSEDAVEFLYTERRVAINLVPIAGLRFLPRRGDTVLLPSESGQPAAGLYEVTDVCHSYTEEAENPTLPCQARLTKVVVDVRKKTG
jgi:hypothetical protein